MVVLGGSGEDEEQHEQIVDSRVEFQTEEEVLECFHCDLGFWDACYTTKTSCSLGELCYTGRGKAGVCVCSYLGIIWCTVDVLRGVILKALVLSPQLMSWM